MKNEKLVKLLRKVARIYQVALEINANPNRLDLNSKQVYSLRNTDANFVINTKSKNVDEMNTLNFGLGQARRGWLEPQNVINTWNSEDLRKFCKK